MVEGRDTDWCVLRTQSPQTMILASALSESGYRAYTPSEVVVRRARRSIPRQEITMPLMPGLVFAAWSNLAEMIALPRTSMTYRIWDPEKKRMATRGYPFFRVLQVGGHYARVTDAQLTGVRLAESQRAVRVKRGTIKPGAAVRMIGGMLDGLIGAVEAIKGNYAQVRFPGWHMPIATALGLLEEVKP